MVFFDALDTHWLKRACAYMQRDKRTLNAFITKGSQQLSIKMQSGRRCSNCARPLGIDRLIAFTVCGFVLSVDIRR